MRRYWKLTIAALLLLAVGAGFVFAGCDTSYSDVRKLEKELNQSSEEVKARSGEKARSLAVEMFNRYSSTKNLSLEATDTIYSIYATRTSRPLGRWVTDRVAKFSMWMTPQRLRTEVRPFDVKQPSFTFILDEHGDFEEIKKLNNRIVEKTKYPTDGVVFRLNEGVEPDLACVMGIFQLPWIGDFSQGIWKKMAERVRSMPAIWNDYIEAGLWLGKLRVAGQQYDVVCRSGTNRQDIFYLREGWVERWDIVKLQDEGTPREVVVLEVHRMTYKEEPITVEQLQPTPEQENPSQGDEKGGA